MAETATGGHKLGWRAADFELKGIDGSRHSLDEVRGANATLVMFICNHCPYVKAVIDDLARECRMLQSDGVGAVAIMSNDTEAYPEDSFDNMKVFARRHDLPFPYVIDETQEVARQYQAVCTPDFFGLDKELKLRYRGRIAEMRGLAPVPNGRRELLEAMRQIARTGRAPADQTPSMGCSIKWRQ